MLDDCVCVCVRCSCVSAIVARHYILPRAQAQLLISTLRTLSRAAAHLLNFMQENKEARTGSSSQQPQNHKRHYASHAMPTVT